MKPFILGLSIGILLSVSGAAAFASESIQAFLTPVTFEKNGKPLATDKGAGVLNYNSHLYVPIRFAAESFGAVIGYDAEKEKVLIKNGTQDMNIYDQKYLGISAGNLIVVKEGDHTRVAGQLQMDQPRIQSNTVQAQLTFYDAQGQPIGEAAIRGDHFGSEPAAFDTVGAGHFQDYASVKLDVQWINGQKIVVDPDPNEPEMALKDIFQLDFNEVNKIEINQMGNNMVLAEKGEGFHQMIQHLQAVQIRKKVDQSVPTGSSYAIHLYVGDVRYTYSATLHLYDNQHRNYGMFVPNDSTKELDRYIESILHK